MLTSSLNRNWFQIILWWEIRRILYNLIMYFAGLLSFYICYISIPLIYLLMGLAFNVVYTFGWIIELSIIKKHEDAERIKFRRYAFIGYLALSVMSVLGVALFLLSFAIF